MYIIKKEQIFYEIPKKKHETLINIEKESMILYRCRFYQKRFCSANVWLILF